MEEGQSVEKKLQDSQWLLGEAQARIQSLENELRDKNQHIEFLQNSFNKVKQQFDESQWYLGEERARKDQLDISLKDSIERACDLQSQLEQLRSQLQGTQKELEEAQWFLGEERAKNACMAQGHLKVNVNTILIADDDPISQKLSSEILIKAGYDVRLANNGKEAMASIEEARPDLLILDIMMPEVNGYEVVYKIKFNSKFPDLPIIILTSQDQIVEPRLSSLLDIEFLHKPCSSLDLVDKVNKVLNVN
ncbi:MAG: response regulator [Candidatus Omnitrophica bacterium]|nr:response regulator [Candidatus Omnitrophota bacterium]